MTIHLSAEAEATLREAFGDTIDREATEALAVEAYRRGKLSLGQFARLLGIDTYAADGVLKDRGIMLDYTIEDFDREVAFLREQRNPK